MIASGKPPSSFSYLSDILVGKLMDKSNGYEAIAARFCTSRSLTIGRASIRSWARTLSAKATVLDLGCGTGLPIASVLIDEGLTVYGLGASPSMIQSFQQHFPTTPVACEAVEDSSFFGRQFDAIIAWGLLFLLPVAVQQLVLQKIADALPSGGRLLFTAPSQAVRWQDVLTETESTSLGSEQYSKLLAAFGLAVLEEFEDEGENHYYHAVKV